MEDLPSFTFDYFFPLPPLICRSRIPRDTVPFQQEKRNRLNLTIKSNNDPEKNLSLTKKKWNKDRKK